MEVHQVTISEVKDLLKAQELRLTNEMNKEINVRVKEEVEREVDRRIKEVKKGIDLW